MFAYLTTLLLHQHHHRHHLLLPWCPHTHPASCRCCLHHQGDTPAHHPLFECVSGLLPQAAQGCPHRWHRRRHLPLLQFLLLHYLLPRFRNLEPWAKLSGSQSDFQDQGLQGGHSHQERSGFQQTHHCLLAGLFGSAPECLGLETPLEGLSCRPIVFNHCPFGHHLPHSCL